MPRAFPLVSLSDFLKGWASVRGLALAMASEFNEQSLTVYNTIISVLSAPHIAYVMLEDKFVQASFDNLHVVDVLPTNADFEAALNAAEEGDSDDEAPPRRRGKKPAAKGRNPVLDASDSSSEEGPLDYDMI